MKSLSDAPGCRFATGADYLATDNQGSVELAVSAGGNTPATTRTYPDCIEYLSGSYLPSRSVDELEQFAADEELREHNLRVDMIMAGQPGISFEQAGLQGREPSCRRF